jgi:hypothetical protein
MYSNALVVHYSRLAFVTKKQIILLSKKVNLPVSIQTLFDNGPVRHR